MSGLLDAADRYRDELPPHDPDAGQWTAEQIASADAFAKLLGVDSWPERRDALLRSCGPTGKARARLRRKANQRRRRDALLREAGR